MIVIPKNAREEFRVERQDFKGTDLLNVRVWFQASEGDMRPGKQGIAIRADLVPDLQDAITQVMQMEGAE